MIEITRAFLLVSLLGSQLDSIGVKAASGLGVNTVAYSQIGLFARHKKIVCVVGLVTLKGSPPDTWLALMDQEEIIYRLIFENDMGDLLAALQNERVQVCGFITGEELGAKLLVVEEIDINPHKP